MAHHTQREGKTQGRLQVSVLVTMLASLSWGEEHGGCDMLVPSPLPPTPSVKTQGGRFMLGMGWWNMDPTTYHIDDESVYFNQ